MRRTLNWKLFLTLLVLAGSLSVGVHVLHAYQVERNARFLREQATAALEHEDREKARHALARYLTSVPTDADALADYGKVLRELGQPALALKAFQQVLELDPSRRDVRRQVIRLALDAEQYATAAAHARDLIQDLAAEQTLEAQAERGELYRTLGRCHEARKRWAEAVEAYGWATHYAPNLYEAFLRRAILLRERLQQPQQADKVMRGLVQANSGSFRAYYERGRYRQLWQQPGADDDLDRARTLARETNLEDVEDLLTAADLAHDDGDQPEARQYLTRALERYPGDRRLYERFSRVELQAGRPAEALAAIQKGLAVLKGDRDLRFRLVETLLGAGRIEEATQELDVLRKEKSFPGVLLSYLDAQVLLRSQHWTESSQLLESIRPRFVGHAELGQLDLFLSQCYDRLGDRDQYFATLRRAIADAARIGMRTSTARFRFGTALLAAGRIEEALGEFGQAAQSPSAPPQTYLRLAEATLAYAQRLPPDQRKQHWDHVAEYLKVADQLLPDSTEVPLLRSQLLTAQGQLDEAETVLRKASGKQPLKIEIWAGRLALLLRQGGEPAAALRLLDEAEGKLGDTADMRLLRAQYWATQTGADARAALANLAKDLDKFGKEEQSRLLTGLADILFRSGDVREAEKLWRRYLDWQPRDFRVRQILFELTLKAGDAAAVEKALKEFQDVEGPEGVYWRSAAVVRLLHQARRMDSKEPLAEVRRLLGEIRPRRPRWPHLMVMEGELAELEGNLEEALTKYLAAIDQGERSPLVIQRAVELLNRTRQFRVVDQLIARLGESAPVSDALRWLTVDASLRGNDLDRAEVVARAAVLANPGDYRQHLLLGQVLSAAGKGDEAEKALLQAVELADHVPETWIALVQHQVRRNPARAVATTEQAREKLPAEVAPLALGACYELLGQREQAEKQYQAALAARPNEAPLLRTVALFYARGGDVPKSEELLRKMLLPAVNAPEALAAWARRTLAVNRASRDYQHLQEAFSLLEENFRRLGPHSPADLRVKALLLDRPGRRHEAIRVMEELINSAGPTPSDQFRLARLYESVGDWARAEPLLGSLSGSGTDASVLAHYARGLLRHGEIEKARSVMDRLAKVDPRGVPTQELRARLLHAEGQSEQAVAVLEGVMQDAKDAAVLGLAAAVLEEMGQAGTAETAYRQFMQRSALPDSALAFARFLARQGRVPEALDLCEQASQKLPAETAAVVMVGAVRAGKAGKDLTERVERWISGALDAATKAKTPSALALAVPLADLFDYQGRYADAMQVYRRLLAQNANDPVAANNLAWLIAALDRKQAGEALQLINHAIDQVAGPLPALLDTRAAVNQALGKTPDAIHDLQSALAETQSPSRWFHLAQAYRDAKQSAEAKDAMQRAKSLGLDPSTLHPLEQPAYKTLAAELGIE